MLHLSMLVVVVSNPGDETPNETTCINVLC